MHFEAKQRTTTPTKASYLLFCNNNEQQHSQKLAICCSTTDVTAHCCVRSVPNPSTLLRTQCSATFYWGLQQVVHQMTQVTEQIIATRKSRGLHPSECINDSKWLKHTSDFQSFFPFLLTS